MIATLVLVAMALATDLNTATEVELLALPAVGPARAAAILHHRSVHGPFASPASLAEVPGIGPPTVRYLRRHADIDTAPTPAEPLSDKVDINQADAAELATLPGVGPAVAQRIVDDRRTLGLFQSCADLERVPGVGPATVSAVAARCIATR